MKNNKKTRLSQAENSKYSPKLPRRRNSWEIRKNEDSLRNQLCEKILYWMKRGKKMTIQIRTKKKKPQKNIKEKRKLKKENKRLKKEN